jgi:hypothetical protein
MPYPYETATPEQRAAGAWWLCVHHEIHCEPLTEPVEDRVQYIRTNKPKHEIETRLRELAPVLHPERLPETLVKASRAYGEARRMYGEAQRMYGEAQRAYAEAQLAYNEVRRVYDEVRRAYYEARRVYNEAWRAYNEASRAYNEVRRAYYEARRMCEPELKALHREEYPDTKWNGRSIF